MGPSIILLVLYSLEGLDHLGNDLEEVSYDTVVCDLEDRSSIVLVYRDDALGILHACLVLDGTGDTESDVDLRVNGLTGLAYLMVGSYITGIDSGTIYLGQDALPISRRRRKEIVDALLLYNGGAV